MERRTLTDGEFNAAIRPLLEIKSPASRKDYFRIMGELGFTDSQQWLLMAFPDLFQDVVCAVRN